MEFRILYECEEEELASEERVREIAIFNKLEEPEFIRHQDLESMRSGYSLGIDPGLTGCFFVIDNVSNEPVFCCDMPMIPAGDKDLLDFDMMNMILKYLQRQCSHLTATLEVPIFPKPRMSPVKCKCGATLFRPQHNAPKSTAGQWVAYSYCDIAMRLSKIPTMRRLPNSWEPVVTKGVTGAGDSKFKIEVASNEVFGNLPIFYGPRGGARQDRRDAAMLAFYNKLQRGAAQ